MLQQWYEDTETVSALEQAQKEREEVLNIVDELKFSQISETLFDDYEVIDRLLESIWKANDLQESVAQLRVFIERAAIKTAEMERDERNKRNQAAGGLSGLRRFDRR